MEVDNIPTMQLTQYGFEMERYNGEYFSKKYYKFLSSEYHRESVYIVADDTNRDIFSAQVVLLGMFSYIKKL